jgi:hypothetical protein
MAAEWRIAGAILVAVAIATSFTACGGSSSDADEVEASKSFLQPGGKNKIAKFGEEASADEREAASEVLEENLEAREAGEWAKQCSSLTTGAVKRLQEENVERNFPKGNCTESLSAQGETLGTEAVRENTMTGPIDALRVKGDRGYALYHGTEGKDYSMAMKKVNDEWKVDSLITEEI